MTSDRPSRVGTAVFSLAVVVVLVVALYGGVSLAFTLGNEVFDEQTAAVHDPDGLVTAVNITADNRFEVVLGDRAPPTGTAVVGIVAPDGTLIASQTVPAGPRRLVLPGVDPWGSAPEPQVGSYALIVIVNETTHRYAVRVTNHEPLPRLP